ncbi:MULTISPECIES: nitrogenase molybdenum-iron protein subunit beta [unclassified Roseofilum]|uniref:nitrogenase molybdenum-iron protein subunit beta n=1 Tax=unclassified Roseofilum TaxID=2620099 RepID=UPI000E80E95A|nr:MULTISPECIES: nitrogenase molybdenum-iron protein subunit beta [unclassified Roseofilum]HBR00972.1 nitrogenase molybdenum-iron protein subunit beta [Cyanobacteria bacterium UBA11691]MBP0008322.1 nitrogenase molybdenum-iron protein subunit beta [Roseofilum sp. Belize Diploria]MBP0013170.1 nitrogenase molybdenum-iron protein subunit beta [Roseofilum sp. SID3]MBP0023253.1 nitrogenase molybdenum-iron protein subunit beta [Roseofilum sp. SID2]MBP0033143.1 nitrogenase molybdenum-iron protein subu
MLEATPKEVVERKALRVNPAKTCQPIGAMYAALGIHGCLPHSHGSQGCCSYHRSHLTRHYRDPIMAATSSFTEGSAVFGGGANLRQAFTTMYKLYDPDVIAINTTCLSETIGDDIPTLIREARESGIIPEGKVVIHANTPSYVGTHVTGWSNMTAGIVKYLSEKTETPQQQINVIPGYVEPSDIRQIKHLLDQIGVNSVVFPDTSDVVDTPQTGTFEMYPKGGTSVEALHTTGDSIATLALGPDASKQAAKELENKCKVPYQLLDLPIGIAATDRFIQAIIETTGAAVPESLKDDRGRLVDLMTDMQQYLYGKRVALAGDPDQIVPLTEFLVSCGAKPMYVITGTASKYFTTRCKEILEEWVPDAIVKDDTDLFYLHQLIKTNPVDLLITNVYGKYIARSEDIPLVRFGWPILDRVGHSFFPSVGYKGSMHLLCNIINTILERKDRDDPDEIFELAL